MTAPRIGVLVAALAAAAVALLPSAALAEPKTYTFTGAITPEECGPLHTFDVSTGNKEIVAAATTVLATNDIVFKLIRNGTTLASADTLTSPEQIVYAPGGELPAGQYAIQVCPYVGGALGVVPIVPPYDYTAVVTVTPLGLPSSPGVIGGDSGLVQTPKRVEGSLKLAAPTVIDAQRTEGEPLNYVDQKGALWESGPYGFSTAQSWVHRSVDGGKQWNVVSPIKLRPNMPPGGGDTDLVVDDQGTVYFTDLEGLVSLDASVSNDDGATWRKNPIAGDIGVDRQWYAVDNGPTASVHDNTIFLGVRVVGRGIFVFSSPGSLGPNDMVGGLVFQNASASPLPLGGETTCGQLKFDPVKRNLYYPCLEGDHLRISTAHVEPGQRTGLQFRNSLTPKSPSGTPGNLFPAIAIDGKGTVYATWVDETDYNVYMSLSTDEGRSWSKPLQINSGDAKTSEFVWVDARGSEVAVGWLGTDSTGVLSDNMPQYSSAPTQADDYKWYGYIASISNASSSKPTIAQQRFTPKPMHYGEICNSGIGCTAGGDRTMADYFSLNYDLEGKLRIVYNDTTTPEHGAHLYEVHEGSSQTNPSDATNDAQWPHYSPEGPGPNMDNLDITRLKVTQPNKETLRFDITVREFGTQAPQGSTNALWLVRFQAQGFNDAGAEAYPIYYAGAESELGGPPKFFAGYTDCIRTTSCKMVVYPRRKPAIGKVSGNTITIDVPIDSGFGKAIPGPYKKKVLYSVTAFTFGRTNDVADVYADVDATPSFNLTLK